MSAPGLAFDNKTVLIVDDSPNDHFLMKRWIERKGVKDIRYCSSGEDALQTINEMAKNPDLIMLDLDLRDNGLNGIDVLHALRSRKTTKDIKICVVSGNYELLENAGQADMRFRKTSYADLMNSIDQALSMLY